MLDMIRCSIVKVSRSEYDRSTGLVSWIYNLKERVFNISTSVFSTMGLVKAPKPA